VLSPPRLLRNLNANSLSAGLPVHHFLVSGRGFDDQHAGDTRELGIERIQ
jgi:hypothetical protein